MCVQFGRLDGFVTAKTDGRRRVSVVLDTGREVETLRDEGLPDALEHHEMAQFVEQLVQEAIGNELECDGWEVAGVGDTDHESHRMLDVVARSRTWIVRRQT